MSGSRPYTLRSEPYFSTGSDLLRLRNQPPLDTIDTILQCDALNPTVNNSTTYQFYSEDSKVPSKDLNNFQGKYGVSVKIKNAATVNPTPIDHNFLAMSARYRNNVRGVKESSVSEYYNANQLDRSANSNLQDGRFQVGEGPKNENFDVLLQHWLESGITDVFTVGEPTESTGKKYYDYLAMPENQDTVTEEYERFDVSGKSKGGFKIDKTKLPQYKDEPGEMVDTIYQPYEMVVTPFDENRKEGEPKTILIHKFSIPDHAACDLTFTELSRLQSMFDKKDANFFAHCSAGLGRSGMYALAYILYRDLKNNEKKFFDDKGNPKFNEIFNKLKDLRKVRPGLIQHAEQLHFAIRTAMELNAIRNNILTEKNLSRIRSDFDIKISININENMVKNFESKKNDIYVPLQMKSESPVHNLLAECRVVLEQYNTLQKGVLRKYQNQCDILINLCAIDDSANFKALLSELVKQQLTKHEKKFSLFSSKTNYYEFLNQNPNKHHFSRILIYLLERIDPDNTQLKRAGKDKVNLTIPASYPKISAALVTEVLKRPQSPLRQ